MDIKIINNGSFNIETTTALGQYIEFLRKELINTGQQYGLNSREALEVSQELDKYLSVCQRCCPKGICN
ncbi:hypothetical protein CJ195_17540 [Bacillus sp. UMB0899]|uniref:aspartyl-phosphate phosphatase Spo0E family protein n=1 Tax=Metabacillus schmidteae TaxID=2730405 RepID=UPI000C80DF27|nr:aspartyl-phosphate phosphatase Spo0E family protein [Metabacillus schmidteae]PMC36048.1 hypothetical protein CJ195_17540 [Bacillus sp. UMB0899]